VKYLVLAALLFIAGIGVTQLERETVPFTPVVRVRTVEGLFLTLVQPGTPSRSACNTAVQDLVDGFGKACANCVIESSDCASKLEGIDRALALNQPIPLYTISAQGFRISVLGPPQTVKAACEAIASQMVKGGLKTASCASPPVI